MKHTLELKLGVGIALLAGLVGCDGSTGSQRVEAGGLERLDSQIEQLATARTAEPPVVAVHNGLADGKAKAVSTPRPKTAEPDDEPAVDLDAELRVKRLVIAHGVENREPVQPATAFTKGEQERIYAFVEVGNQDRANSEIFVSFVRKGTEERGRIRLRVGASPRWRTWAYTRLAREEGQWVAIVRDARGDELARTEFEIRGGAPAEPAADSATASAA